MPRMDSISTGSGAYSDAQRDAGGATIRNRRVTYDHLSEFLHDNHAHVVSIVVNDRNVSKVHALRFLHQPTRNYHAKAIQEAVELEIVFVLRSNSGGAALIGKVKELVEDVLKKDYEAKTLKVFQGTGKEDDEPKTEWELHDSVICSGRTFIEGNEIRVGFKIVGLSQGHKEEH